MRDLEKLHVEEGQRWFDDTGGTDNLHYDYPLNENSHVFDVGGYQGNWTAEIIARYDPWISVLEPALEFFNVLKERFSFHPKVKLYNFGLSDANKFQFLFLNGAGSSLYKDGPSFEEVELKDAATSLVFQDIDLMSINVEGEEYKILPRLTETGIISRIDNLQIQFHTFYPNADEERNKIREALRKTHTETYCYEFIWESWKRK